MSSGEFLSSLVERLPSFSKGRFTCPSCHGPASITGEGPACENGCTPEQMRKALAARPDRCTEHHVPDNPADKCPNCWAERAWARREGERRSADDDGSGWASTKLTDALPVPPPTILEVGEETGDFLIRRGWVTLLHGPFASGKTPLSYLAVVEQVRAGRNALIVDHEMGPSGALALLRELGLTVEQIDQHVHYIHLPPPMSTAGKRWLVEEVAGRGMEDLSVVVIDSLTQSMATVPGADDNRALDVTAWADELPIWLAEQFNAGVIVIDHSTVGDRDRPSGSHKKREFPQFHLWCRKDTPFSRERPDAGQSTLIVMKDRSGERAVKKAVAILRTRPGGTFHLTAPEVPKDGEVELSLDQQPEGGTKEEVYADLLDAGKEGILKTPLCGSGEKGKYRRGALASLVSEERAVERSDPASSRARRCWADVHAPE